MVPQREADPVQMGSIRHVARRLMNAAIAMGVRLMRGERGIKVVLAGIGKSMPREVWMKMCRDEMQRTIEPEEQGCIPSFEKGSGPEKDRFESYQRHYTQFNIKAGDRVLDVGSGGHPFPYATHIADFYPDATSHRSEPLRKLDLNFQACNIESLPYQNKEFDFVYCSHVLEHVENPGRACKELMRVGRKGYIETPTRLSDVMMNYTRLKDHHKWHVNALGNALIFMEWEDRERRDTGVNDFYMMLQSKYKNPFQDLFRSHRDLFVNMFSWEDKFTYYVYSKDGILLDSNAQLVAQPSISGQG